MAQSQRDTRVLIYSHDSFGLGHLRRCREIAHTLAKAEDNLSVLILSGSPIIGNYGFVSRVDFVRVPGVIKLRDGDYTSLSLRIDISDTLAIRSSIIEHTAKVYDPDIFIVDKEPLGLRGEVKSTLELLKSRGTPCVLGLRDVMDEPDLLAPEWERKGVEPALRNYYDHIWIYGLPQICNPLEGINLTPSVLRKVTYTGYLRRSTTEDAPQPKTEKIKDPFLLVTVGGGGDGEAIIDWVLRAYETDRDLPYPALIVLGPFMGSELQNDFIERVDRLDNVEAITFDAQLESFMKRAIAVIGMGGYNTFCEILSFDKRALIVPRTEPRLEQFIRASRAQDLGLLTMLMDDGIRSATTMATALRNLPQQGLPSETVIPGLLDGRENVIKLTRQWLAKRRPRLAAIDDDRDEAVMPGGS
jgi:predicted glycosyltransferase